MITDMRFLSDGKHVRIYQQRGKAIFYTIDVNVYDLTPEVKKQEGAPHRWDDRSIFKYGLTYVHQQETLNRFIHD